jgi:solute carrier family 10 (sodium/bile acid cotransporter), member 7
MQEDITGTPFAQICLLILVGVGIHVVYLALNYTVSKVIRLGLRDHIAVVIMASQKTLPIAIAVISFLPAKKWGRSGLLTIPCIIGHVSQLFIDAAIANRWANEEERRAKQQELEASSGESDLQEAVGEKVRAHDDSQ